MNLFKKTYLVRTNLSEKKLKKLFRYDYQTFLNNRYKNRDYLLSHHKLDGPYTITTAENECETIIEVKSDEESSILEITTQFTSDQRRYYYGFTSFSVFYFTLLGLAFFTSSVSLASAKALLFFKFVAGLSILAFVILGGFAAIGLFLNSNLKVESKNHQKAVLLIAQGELLSENSTTNDEIVKKKTKTL